MRLVVILCGCLLASAPVFAQAVSQPTASRPPTLAEVRSSMGIPSWDLEVRGPLEPESFGAIPTPGVGTSVGWPQLPVQGLGLGTTGPASLYHFVGHPAAAFTIR